MAVRGTDVSSGQIIPCVHMLLLVTRPKSSHLCFKSDVSIGGFAQLARYVETNEKGVCCCLTWGERSYWGSTWSKFYTCCKVSLEAVADDAEHPD